MPSRLELIAFFLTVAVIWLVITQPWTPSLVHRGIPLVGAAAIEQPSIVQGAKAINAGAH